MNETFASFVLREKFLLRQFLCKISKNFELLFTSKEHVVNILRILSRIVINKVAFQKFEVI